MSHQKLSSGTVELVRHPLVFVRGLSESYVGQQVEFQTGIYGQVTALGTELIEVMVFSSTPITADQTVTPCDQVVSVKLTDSCIGKTLSIFGESAPDGQLFPIDTLPKPISDRARVTEPLYTGLSSIDLLLPLGKGQRELLLGDRKTGKTALALQIARAQILQGSKVVYGVIGKLSSEIKHMQQWCCDQGISDAITFVISKAGDPPSQIFQTPFTAMTVGEFLNSLGHDVVVILDDLTTHAHYYRELSLLGKRFPGRDSYPGDIFFTHARLLERAGCFKHPVVEGKTITLSCLPLAETTDSELTSYIVSNLISITDGHLLLDTALFSQGRRPAITTSLSVTRVGKQTRSQLEQELCQALTTFFNTYEKVSNLIHFGAELNAETQQIISRGIALSFFLNQKRTESFSPATMILITTAIWLNWFSEDNLEEIQIARTIIEDHYKHDPIFKKELDRLIEKSHSFSIFQTEMEQDKKSISSIWQH